MTAPVVTARGTPLFYQMPEGMFATIAFSLDPTVCFWEKSLKPPGFDGGAPIDQTTQLNTAWKTSAPRVLKKLMPLTGKAAYNPDVMDKINNDLLNKPGSITYHFPDTSTIAFYGYLQKIDFDDLEEGKLPELSFTIEVTNFDPVNHVEAGPVITPAVGT
jgi:hypothetical protein